MAATEKEFEQHCQRFQKPFHEPSWTVELRSALDNCICLAKDSNSTDFQLLLILRRLRAYVPHRLSVSGCPIRGNAELGADSQSKGFARGNPLDDGLLPKLGLAAHIRSAVSGGQCFSAAKSLTLEVNYRADLARHLRFNVLADF